MDQTIAEISGIDVQVFGSVDEFAEQILPGPQDLTTGFAVAINPEKIMAARRDPDTRAALDSATLRYADGAGVVWAMRRRGINAPRVTGADLWERLMARAADCEVPVSLLGGKPEVLDMSVERLHAEFPKLKIAATLHGYASDGEIEEFTKKIDDMGRGIVAVAMGSPRQEKVIKSLRQHCPNAFYMGVGGTFDCYSGVVRRAPDSWQRLNLEWFYRLLRQPWRIKRQLKLIPYAALVLARRV
jgi:UDP-N-acetyl-D-mannosaminouronate:lipid I N-acetyl-D-mannosaminouronosyltransferase